MDENQAAAGQDAADLVSLTADIVSAYLANNPTAIADVPSVIASVHVSLGGLGKPKQPAAPDYTPAVPVKKSVTEDAIISLIDGKQYRSLKRHLKGHGLTPADYRQRYNLPVDYPMVAASYSAARRELAKSIGLGAIRRKGSAKATEPDPVVAELAPKRRGRPPKA